jgi:flagellar biosynthesis/type III secretory pathway M-ring protein FliF/YscJ
VTATATGHTLININKSYNSIEFWDRLLMNIKIVLMLAVIVLVVSVATITIVSNPAIAVKPEHHIIMERV